MTPLESARASTDHELVQHIGSSTMDRLVAAERACADSELSAAHKKNAEDREQWERERDQFAKINSSLKEKIAGMEKALKTLVSAIELPRYDDKTPHPPLPKIISTHAASGQTRCEKHGIGYNGCICCENEVREHRNDCHREAARIRETALQAARDSALSTLTGGETQEAHDA